MSKYPSARSDVVVGLDAGAIDDITKPFKLAELLARIRAQFRRAEPRPHPRWFTIFRPGPDPQIDIVLQRVLSPGR